MFFFKRYALGHASTRERGLHRSVRKRSRGFLHDASLKLGLSRATRGLVPHRRVPEWVSLSVRWMESFHEKVSVPIPAKCDNLVLGDSKRWRTLERIAGTRHSAIQKAGERQRQKKKKFLTEKAAPSLTTGAVLGRVFSRNKYLRVPFWVKTQCERLSRTAIANSISPHPLSLIFFFATRKRGMTGRWVWVKNPELEHGEPQNINRFTLLQ